ncbi:MAG TPA: ParB N-terminal domain-containing protein [Gemmata sp.]|nr:ParB N-terminal domain-containing protein [Gemmata sp.]
MSPLEIRVMAVGDLTPAPYNPRRPLGPSSPAYRRLKTSLAEFGLVEPLVWNEPTGRVVGGHLRLAILKELGVAEVPVSVVRLSEAREKALNVVLNNREAQGQFDPSLLAELLRELEDLPEFALTGFDPRALAPLDLRPAESRADTPEPDRVEVTLTTDQATYDRVAPELDAIVSRYDIVAHVRRKQ